MRLFIFAIMMLAGSVYAQDSGKKVRETSLQMSRYEQIIGKLQDQNERFLSDLRALQRKNEQLSKDLEASNSRTQNVSDELQRMQNAQLNNGRRLVWGDGQRDCKEINAKHQQIKVTVKPDGSRGVRFLCYDGKALHMGSEVYMPSDD